MKNEQLSVPPIQGNARPKRCVYTAITGGYEPLNQQPACRDSALPFICFTDNPVSCEGWEIRPLVPVFPGDPIRSQRAYKLRPHLVLPEFDQSLYIDNTVLLRQPPEQLFEAINFGSGMALPRHSYRASVRDEFQVIVADGLDDPARVAEQLEHYLASFPDILTRPAYWAGLLLRDHHVSKVQAAMEIWLAHVYRYSRRDQLSGAIAFHIAGLVPETLEIDNHESAFHSWPNLVGRKAERRLWRDEAPETLILRLENAELQQMLETLRQTGDQLREQLAQSHHDQELLRSSTSWRLTAPLRASKDFFF